MSETHDAESVRREMAKIRQDLAENVDGIVTNARVLSDWRHYLRQYPWACIGAAAAVGFFAVPRRLQIMTPDAETLAKLASQDRLVVTPKAEAQQSSLMGTMISIGAKMLFRSAIAYVGQQVGKATTEAQQNTAASATMPTTQGADRPPNH